MLWNCWKLQFLYSRLLSHFKSLFSTKIQVFHFQNWQKVIFRMVHPVLCLILIWQKPSGLEFVLQEIDYVTPLSWIMNELSIIAPQCGKTKNFLSPLKYFVKSILIISLVKSLLSQSFCQKCVRVNFCIFHTVYL